MGSPLLRLSTEVEEDEKHEKMGEGGGGRFEIQGGKDADDEQFWAYGPSGPELFLNAFLNRFQFPQFQWTGESVYQPPFFQKSEKTQGHPRKRNQNRKSAFISSKQATRRFEKRKEEEGVVVCCIRGATGAVHEPIRNRFKLACCSCRHLAKPSLPVAAAATQCRTADLHHIPCMQRQTLKSKTLTRPTSKRLPNSRQLSTAECRGREIQSDHRHRCPRPASQPVPMIR